MDVKNAFLHGNIDEEIYMKQPCGLEDNTDRVCKLNKSLYGLKQAPRAWNSRFDSLMKKLGLKQSEHDKCLYFITNDKVKVYILLYVDDILLAGNDEGELLNIKLMLENEFKMKDLGEPQCFLGIKIDRNENGMFLSQSTYVRNLLKRFNMEDCNPSKTPMEIKPVEESAECIVDKKPYRELVGCLMYLMSTTRPDISVAVNYYSRFQSNATEVHWQGLKRILRYIKGTMDMGLFYQKGKDKVLTVYADADWASSNDRKSITGFLIEVYGAVVCWATRKQTTVALSSTEAEYVALASATSEAIWLRNLLQDFGLTVDDPVEIYEDNQSCIHLLKKWEHRRLKHIDVKYNFIRDLYSNKVIDVQYVASRDQKADILTKRLPAPQFIKLRSTLCVCNG